MQQQRKWAGSDAQAHPWLQIEFEASLRNATLSQKKKRRRRSQAVRGSSFIQSKEDARSIALEDMGTKSPV